MIDITNTQKYSVAIFLKVIGSSIRSAHDIIEEHRLVASENGYSWWGNNQPFTPEKLNHFFQAGQKPKVIMVIPIGHNGNGNVCYIADIQDAVKNQEGILCPEINYMPKYYASEKNKVWLKLRNFELITKNIAEIYNVDKYYLLSNDEMLKSKLKTQYSCGYVYKINEHNYSNKKIIRDKLGKYDSWEIVSKDTAIKKTDKSVLDYKGSSIPKEVRWFFDAENEDEQYRHDISLIFNSKKFSAYLAFEKSIDQRLCIFWYTDLKKEIEKLYSDYNVFLKNDYPLLQFIKVNKNKYQIDFIDTSICNIDDELISIVDVKSLNGRKEGRMKAYYTTIYERDPKNREKAIEIHGLTCKVCGVNFEKTYGERGKGYIEIHHKKALYLAKKEIIVDVATDLVPVCSNCHRMIHRKKDEILTVEELIELIRCQAK